MRIYRHADTHLQTCRCWDVHVQMLGCARAAAAMRRTHPGNYGKAAAGIQRHATGLHRAHIILQMSTADKRYRCRVTSVRTEFSPRYYGNSTALLRNFLCVRAEFLPRPGRHIPDGLTPNRSWRGQAPVMTGMPASDSPTIIQKGRKDMRLSFLSPLSFVLSTFHLYPFTFILSPLSFHLRTSYFTATL